MEAADPLMFLAIVGVTLVLGAGAGLVYQRRGVARDAIAHPPPGRRVDLGDGRRLHLHCVGAGEPAVIFEAGIAASSLSWARVQPEVAKFARACAYDRAGLAWSDPRRGRLSALGLAEDLRALLEAAAIPGPYVLVAHSFGTFVSRAFAHRYHRDVAGLVLVDPIVPSEWLSMRREDRRRLRGGVLLSRVGAVLASAGVVRVCLDLLSRGSTGVPRRVSRLFGVEASRVLARLIGEVQKLPREVWPAAQAHWSQAKSFRAMASHLSALERSAAEIEACGDLGEVPIAVITAASQSPAARAEHARIAALSSNGRHILCPEGGHWVHLDAPGLVVAVIRELVMERS